MDVVTLRPQPSGHLAARPAARPGAAPGVRRPAHPAPAAPHADAVLEQQRGFDDAVALQAEQQREANVLREMAMAQLKHEDTFMNDWIKMM